MTTGQNGQIFFVAPFACNGEFFGVAPRSIAELSPRWLAYCLELLKGHGDAFAIDLPPPLHRIRIRFTSAGGAALTTYFFDGVPLASSALLRGDDQSVEEELLSMFVLSARRSEIVRASQTTNEPFAEIFDIHERPLHAVITFGGGDEAETIPELGTHFAGAFLHCARS